MADFFASVAASPAGSELFQRLTVAAIEVAVIAALAGLVLWTCRVKSPRLRALVWLIVLAKPVVTLLVGPVTPIVSLGETPLARLAPPPASSAGTVPLVCTEVDVVTKQSGRHTETQEDKALMPPAAATRSPAAAGAIIVLWLLGAALALTAAVVNRLRLGRFMAQTRGAPRGVAAEYARVATEMEIRRAPPLVVTEHLESPALVGTFTPRVILPGWLVRGGDSANATSRQLVWAIRHELTHFNMRDNWALHLIEVCQVLFFFHPAVWIGSRRWRDAAEMACDRQMVADRRSAIDYADQLYEMIVKVRDRKRASLATSLFASRTQIGRRIEALLCAPAAAGKPLGRSATLALALTAALVLGTGADFAPTAGTDVTTAAVDVSLTTENVAHTVDADDSESFNIVRTYRDGRTLRLKARGKFDFSGDHTRIVSMKEKSRLVLSEQKGDDVRKIVVTAGEDGKPVYGYTVNGEDETLDDAAREWFSRSLKECLKSLGRERDWDDDITYNAP